MLLKALVEEQDMSDVESQAVGVDGDTVSEELYLVTKRRLQDVENERTALQAKLQQVLDAFKAERKAQKSLLEVC